MAKSKRKRVPKTVLKLPDLEQSKSAVLNSLTSSSSKRSYDHAIREFIDWYCSEPRLANNDVPPVTASCVWADKTAGNAVTCRVRPAAAKTDIVSATFRRRF